MDFSECQSLQREEWEVLEVRIYLSLQRKLSKEICSPSTPNAFPATCAIAPSR